MTKNELLDLLVSWENLELIINTISLNPEYTDMLIDIALHSNHPKRWRAAWMADKINDRSPALIDPYIKDMIAALHTEQDTGVKRHFLKLISIHEIPGEYHSFLLNYALQCFSSSREPVSVRVHAMQILFNISECEPDFKPELLEIIMHEAELHSTPGITSRGKKIINQLRKQLRSSGIHHF